MKKISEETKWAGAINDCRIVTIECTEEEREKLREALAIIAKWEKATGVKREHADWTMINNYSFSRRNNTVKVEIKQGACG